MLSAAKLSSVLSNKLGGSPAAGAAVPELAKQLVQAWQNQSQGIIAINDKPDTTATVIFSHGLGDTGNGWSMGFQYEVAPKLPHVRFLFPTATQIPVTLNMGMRMPAWYDIPSLDKNRLAMDADGITDAVAYIQSIAVVERERLQTVLKAESADVASKRIVIAGFSQGAALSYMAGHTFPSPLGGIGALSGYLTARKELESNWESCNAATPLFTAHGTNDPVVPFSSGKESFELITKMKTERSAASGSDVSAVFKQYPMEHSSCPEEMDAFVAFLNRVVPKP
jgi:predicted esterase